MKLHLIAAALPPQLDGIGDYTANLAMELAKSQGVTILAAREQNPAPISGVAVEQVFSPAQPRSIRQIERRVVMEKPDWVLLQYNPFSYGRWGWNPYLPLMMRRIKRRCRHTRFALMVHEPYVHTSNWQSAVMTVWQRWQLWMLGRSANVVFFSIEAWCETLRSWFPGQRVLHLPVGSNIPLVETSRKEARSQLGLGEETKVIGIFGTAGHGRMLGMLRAAVIECEAKHDICVLYIGPHGQAIHASLVAVRVLDEGALPAAEVSRRFAAMDVYVAPLVDGVSTRRTSLMTALQHGVATVGTRGHLTDGMLEKENGRCFLLSDVGAPAEFSFHLQRVLEDRSLRERLGNEARVLYQKEFTWQRIASRLLAVMEERS